MAVTAATCQCAEGHIFHQQHLAIWQSPPAITPAALELPAVWHMCSSRIDQHIYLQPVFISLHPNPEVIYTLMSKL